MNALHLLLQLFIAVRILIYDVLKLVGVHVFT